MKILLLILLLIPANLFANVAVYDEAEQTVINKVIGIKEGTVAELGAVTGMTDGFKYTVTDGSTMTSCTSGGGSHKVECCYDESEAEWEACHPGINPTAYPVILTTIPTFAGRGLVVGSDSKSIDVLPDKVTADPCGTYPEAAIFYNDTADILCLCNGAGADVKVSDGNPCF